ncbi:unnamed protein product, partial [Symbiodinium pilosum]
VETEGEILWDSLGESHQAAKKGSTLCWKAMLKASRSGLQLEEAFASSADSNGPETGDFNIFQDIGWHRRAIARSQSVSGFLILPSFSGLVAAFLVASLFHAAGYACSKGQLADLKLATDVHRLHFQPHQQKYVVHMDTSFKQVVLQGMVSASQTRWMSLQQPNTASRVGTARVQLIDEESFGQEEIHLSQAVIPRISTVRVQGLRPSLPAADVGEGEVASVPKVLSASADALCELLQKGCDVCDLVADGLGACRDSERWCQLNHFREAPPLSAEGRVQVLACGLQAKLNGCGVDDWSYQRGHLVNGYEKVPNSSIPLQTLANKAAALGEIGSKLLTHLLGTASSEEKAASFRSDLTEAIWKVPGKLGASFLSTLAASHDDMPRTLLIALVRLGQGDK